LSRASVEGLRTSAGFESTLFCLFEVNSSADGLPVAAVCRLGEGEPVTEEYWLLADPVHLLVQRDRVLLAAALAGELERVESEALVAQFNAHFAEQGMALTVAAGGRWYLRLAEPAALVTTPTQRLVGHDIHPALPRGRDGGRWHGLLNEIQMLFHAHPINIEREARGLPAVNALWIWGGGQLPQGATSHYRAVYSSEPLARGLARLATVPDHPLPEDLATLLAGEEACGRLLVVDHRLAQQGQSITAAAVGGDPLAELERTWFAPAREALAAGRLDLIELIAADGRLFRIGRRARRLFWRRRRPLTAYRPDRS